MLLHKIINVCCICICCLLLIQEEVYPFSWSQTELHHIFPQAFAGWFRERDIEPNFWCIPLTREQHTGAVTGIHHKKFAISGGQNFNGSWKFFIDKNPRATKEKCFSFATLLLAEFGINLQSQKFYNYITRQATNVKIPKGKIINKSYEFAGKYLKSGGRLFRLSPYILVAWELYDCGSAFDIDIDEEKFDKGIVAYMEGEALYKENKPEEARGKFLIANFLLGSVFHKEIMKQTTNLYAEISNRFHTDRQRKAFDLCLYFLKNAHKIKMELNIVMPQIPLYVGEIFAISGNHSEAVQYLREAESEFIQKGNHKLANEVNKLINVL